MPDLRTQVYLTNDDLEIIKQLLHNVRPYADSPDPLGDSLGAMGVTNMTNELVPIIESMLQRAYDMGHSQKQKGLQ